MVAGLPEFSLRQKVFLWLDHLEAQGDSCSGIACTQPGISHGIDMDRGHVSRTLAPLVTSGLVEEHTVRVPGLPRVLKGYGLTDAGRAELSDLQRLLHGLEVEVRRLGSSPVRIRVADALARAEARKTCWDVLEELTRHGYIDLSGARVTPPLTARFIHDLTECPPERPFVGRASEVAELASWLDRPVGPCWAVEGPGGIGKSALVAHAIRSSPQRRHIVWMRVAEWTTGEAIAERLAGVLAELGRPGTLPEEPDRLHRDLVRRVHGLPILVVVDDVHKASPGARQALRVLATVAGTEPWLRLVVVGRDAAALHDVAGEVTLLRLAPLATPDAERLLDALGVPAEVRSRLAATGGGVPLFLEILGHGPSPDPKEADFARYLSEVVAPSLPSVEKQVLRWAAAIRGPVGAEFFARLGVGSRVALDGLSRAGLLLHRPDGRYEMHDVVREAFLSAMAFDERVRIHDRLAGLFQPSDSDVSDLTEFLHHLVEAGRRDDALRWVLRHRGLIIQRAQHLFARADESRENARGGPPDR